jgi:hypothetical protein
MPVEVQWHASLPILMTTFDGDISVDDFFAMRDRRQSMLGEGPDRVIVVADTQQMADFTAAHGLDVQDTVFDHDQVAFLLVVVETSFFERIARMLATGEQQGFPFPVQVYPSLDDALLGAESLLGRAN